MSLFVFKTLHQAWRFIRILGGFLFLVLGIVLLVAPGPGWLVIILGLGLLAAEFAWARLLLDRVKREGQRLRAFVFPGRQTGGA